MRSPLLLLPLEKTTKDVQKEVLDHIGGESPHTPYGGVPPYPLSPVGHLPMAQGVIGERRSPTRGVNIMVYARKKTWSAYIAYTGGGGGGSPHSKIDIRCFYAPRNGKKVLKLFEDFVRSKDVTTLTLTCNAHGTQVAKHAWNLNEDSDLNFFVARRFRIINLDLCRKRGPRITLEKIIAKKDTSMEKLEKMYSLYAHAW